MSLIHDALKRAQKQPKDQPAPKLPLEFLPPAPGTGCCAGPRYLGVTLVLLAVLGLVALLVWVTWSPPGRGVPVAARTAVAPVNNAPVAAVIPPLPSTNLSGAGAEPVATNTAPVAATPVVEPLRLQGISFNPSAPSAVVNGRVLYLGDTVNGFRLTAVSPVAVTLQRGTESQVLSLSR